jgi:hypothetical protein
MDLTKKDKLRGLKIPSDLTNELAYLCGILAGDGNINFRKSKNEYAIKCVGNPKDEKLFYFKIIKPLFKSIFGLDLNLKYFDGNTTFGFVVYSKTLVNYLTQSIGLPLGKKQYSLRVPSIFLENQEILLNFIKGVFDTDGCISFKRKYKDYPYYPVISLSSNNSLFIKDISGVLKKIKFKVYEVYNYKVKDDRIKKGFTLINRIELNGEDNLVNWFKTLGFSNPKHLEKVKKYWKVK